MGSGYLTLSLLQYSGLLIGVGMSLSLHMSHLSLCHDRIASHHALLHSCLLHGMMALLLHSKLLSSLWVVHTILHLLTGRHHLSLLHLWCWRHHTGMRTSLTHPLSRSALSHYWRSLRHCWCIVRYLWCTIPTWSLVAWTSGHSHSWVAVLHSRSRTRWATRHALLRTLRRHRHSLCLAIVDNGRRIAVRRALSHDRRRHRLPLSDLVVHVWRNTTELSHLLCVLLSLLLLLSLNLLLHLKLLLLLLRGRGLDSDPFLFL